MKKIPVRFGFLPVAALAFLVLIAGYAAWHFLTADGDTLKFKQAKVERGSITAAVSATGTLNPVVSVQVGSQISGQIKELLVDFNSPVKAGQLIARLDPETYRQRVIQAQADTEAARANLVMQQADVLRVQANLADAQRDYARKRLLVEKKFISPADLDKAQTTFDAATAALRVAQAQALSGVAQLRQRQALLAQAQVDLSRTEIRSPVDGVVVKRSVDTGQTVAASLQAPELFIIAKNLSDMQVETSVDEADVGRIQPGQSVSFTVDAFPEQHFAGQIKQVRKAASIVSNVVSYTVVVSAANPDLLLLPGMTANVRIITAHKDNVLKVPNAALRFNPPANSAEKSDKKGPSAVSPAPTFSGWGKDRSNTSRLWILDKNNKPRALSVSLGLTDGSMTEIIVDDPQIKADSEVIVGMQSDARKKPAAGAPGPRML